MSLGNLVAVVFGLAFGGALLMLSPAKAGAAMVGLAAAVTILRFPFWGLLLFALVATFMPYSTVNVGIRSTVSEAILALTWGAVLWHIFLSRLPPAPALRYRSTERMLLWLMLFTVLPFVVGQVIGALAPGYAVMVAARLVTAVAAAAFFGVALTACAELVEGNQFGRASSLVLGGLMVGTVLGLPVATWLGEWYGWRASFFAVALVAVLVGLLVLQLMPAIPGSAGSGSLREELKVFRNAHLWWVYATSLLLIGATFAGFTYFVPILTEVSGFSASTVPLLLVVYGLAQLLQLWLNALTGNRPPTLTFLLPALVSALLWPWVYALLQFVRLRLNVR